MPHFLEEGFLSAKSEGIVQKDRTRILRLIEKTRESREQKPQMNYNIKESDGGVDL